MSEPAFKKHRSDEIQFAVSMVKFENETDESTVRNIVDFDSDELSFANSPVVNEVFIQHLQQINEKQAMNIRLNESNEQYYIAITIENIGQVFLSLNKSKEEEPTLNFESPEGLSQVFIRRL